MKVGLHVGGIAPGDGGGFTFVAELLAALAQGRAACSHEFVLCHHAGGRHLAQMFPSFSTVDLDAEKDSVLTLRERLFAPLPGAADRIWRAAFRVPDAPSWDERVYARHGVQFLVRLVPWSRTTMEIPYAAILWDLQHRNNPWFPEVSAGREWVGREENYSSLLRRASLIFTGTAQGKKEIAGYYQVPEARIKILPFPTPGYARKEPGSGLDRAAPQRLGVPPEYIFYPAQFWPHKNHVAILEACRLIRARTAWDLGVVFTGSDKGNLDYIRRYAQRLGLADRVKILGFVDQPDLIQLYKGAFCLAFATFCGPDNLPPLEAFALGCPVVASDVPGATEQLGDAALYFPPADEAALAERIISLRDGAIRQRLIAAGVRRAQRDSWDGYARGILAGLDEFARIRRAWA